MHFYKIYLEIAITVLSKKNVFLNPFLYVILCDQKLGITIFRKKDLIQSGLIYIQVTLIFINGKKLLHNSLFFAFFTQKNMIMHQMSFSTYIKCNVGEPEPRHWPFKREPEAVK